MTHIRVKKDKKNMNQNQVKLIAIDMDGTLLNSQKEIPEENIKAIQEATAAGIKNRTMYRSPTFRHCSPFWKIGS